MSEMTEYREYQNSLLEEAKLKELEKSKILTEEVIDIQTVKEQREKLKESYYNFKTNVKDSLLSEALISIVTPSLEGVDESVLINTGDMLYNYVKENGGYTEVISNAKVYNRTYALEKIESLIESYSKIIFEKVNPSDENTFKVDTADKDNFLDELDKEDDIESIKQAIILRVTNAEEDFINNNNSDKININSIIRDTSDRINSATADESEVSEAVIDELTRSSKKAINSIRDKRIKNVYEQYVLHIADQVITNESLLVNFKNEDSKLDMDKINNIAKSNYAILETINSLYLEKIDAAYIKNLFA